MQASRLQTGPVSGSGDKWPAMQARPRVHQFRSILGITTPSFEKATIMTEPAPRPVPPRHPARAALPPGIDAADLRRLAAATRSRGRAGRGAQRLAGFRRMREAIACDDWQLAATEALDSRWAAQTGRRAQHIAGMLRGGGTSA